MSDDRLVRLPTSLKAARERLENVKAVRLRYGSRCTVPLGTEERLERLIADLEAAAGARAVPDAWRYGPVRWLPRAIPFGASGRCRVVGYDPKVIAERDLPRWLVEALERRAA